MTRAAILSSLRYLVNELSTDAGTHLDDAGNALEFLNHAMEDVVLDLIQFMPGQFLTTENISLVAGQTTGYTLTAKFWQIWKVAKNTTGESPQPIEIIDPILEQLETNVAETAENPPACYVMGDAIYFVPIAASSKADYAKVYLIRPEAVAVPTDGPTYAPPVTHRLIALKAAELVALSLEANPAPFINQYAARLEKTRMVWLSRFQQKARYIVPDGQDLRAWDSRDRALYDTEWP